MHISVCGFDIKEKKVEPTDRGKSDGASTHFRRRVKDVLRQHFTHIGVISRAFPMTWSPRSPDLNPCEFLSWGYLKALSIKDMFLTLLLQEIK
ncbi:hypothetical protein NPIL_353691 [Nephila pilipes]|uniref:Uncharacterized protein n=1 Tax=Nephila pilipes TaxID=299642 RepID=A0A8X6QJI9_NEPPI|nr:hypothetical protein NPIL_353691 [Nephila pilipes]